jgi:nucleolar protein 58
VQEEEKKLKVGSPEGRKLLLASDDSGQQKKRVSFKKSKTQELKTKEKEELLAKNAKQKNENEDEAAAGGQSSPRKGGPTSSAAVSAGPKKKERRKDEDEGVEEWERDGHKNERKEKDKAIKSKNDDKKSKKALKEKHDKESKSKKKTKKLKKGEPEQSAFEAVTASEKRRSRRYYSIQIGESSATKEKDPPTTKPVSASTIAMPVVTQVGKGGTIKLKNRNAWDALGDELALEIFLHLDTRSLGTVCRDCRVCAVRPQVSVVCVSMRRSAHHF